MGRFDGLLIVLARQGLFSASSKSTVFSARNSLTVETPALLVVQNTWN